MLKMRKILSVALVVVMLLSTVAFNSFALAEGKTLGFVLESDKTVAEIVPGAAVTVTLKFALADFTTLLSDSRICLLYDNTVYTPDVNSRVWLNDLANYAKDATKPNINPNFAKACMDASTMTAEEKASYNSGVLQQILADPTNLGATSKAGIALTEDGNTGISVAQMQIIFNVTGDAAAIAAGNINIAMCDTSSSKAQNMKQTDGTNTPTLFAADAFDASKGNILANMPAAAASILKPMSSQIRFKGVKTEADFAAYNALPEDQKTFDVRTRATISTADFNAKFTDEATAKAGITDFGFVYKAESVGAFNIDDAKAVAQSDSANGYVKQPCTYMQRTAEGYNFTCLISGIADAEHNDKVNCIAYVCFNGEYIFFDEPATADYSALYAVKPVA